MTKKISFWQRLKNAFAWSTPDRRHVAEVTPPHSSALSEPSKRSRPTEASKPTEFFEENFAIANRTGQLIVDLTESPAENFSQNAQFNVTENLDDASSITADDLDMMLASMGYQFTYHPPKDYAAQTSPDANQQNVSAAHKNSIHHFTMQVSDGEQQWGCMLRFFESQQLLAVYSIFPFSVPDSHQGEMLAVMAYLNYDLVLGNVEMDMRDGELRFKTSLDLEVTGLTEFVLAYLLQSNFAVVMRLFGTLLEVVNKATPAQTATQAVETLVASQQAKTFYLLSDTLQ